MGFNLSRTLEFSKLDKTHGIFFLTLTQQKENSWPQKK